MSSLHEFTLLTQAQEYLVALLAAILFVPFWRYLNGRMKAEG
jgi:hypothetical protein